MEIIHPRQRCQHAGCNCEVEAGRNYCGDECRRAEENPERSEMRAQDGGCGCGHPECVQP